MTSPWDAPANAVQVLRGEEHNIMSVHVVPPDASGRLAIEFRTDGDRCLRVYLPGGQLQSLARVLLDLANERQVNQNGSPTKRIDVEAA
jgi:hypothetical protein